MINKKTVLLNAVLSGLLTGGIALADDHAAPATEPHVDAPAADAPVAKKKAKKGGKHAHAKDAKNGCGGKGSCSAEKKAEAEAHKE